MSEEDPQGQMEEGVPQAAPKPSVGERLRAAREARGMDADVVAAALKLSRRQIEALDVGDWAKLPGHTFIRGFVRNYARVVGLDAAELLADLDVPPPQAPRLDVPHNATAVMPEAGRARKRDYATVLAGFAVVAVAVVAYYVVPPDFWQSAPREMSSPPPAAAEPAFPPASASLEAATPGGPSSPVAETAAAPAAAPAAAAPASAVAAVTPAPAANAASAASAKSSGAAGSGKGLQLSFTQPSWVEIRDRSGQVIFSQLNPAGSEREVEGQPPFALVVGNAANVTVRYLGRNIELQPRSKDDVARVTVE